MENNDKMEYLVMLLDIYEEEVLMTHYIGDKIKGKDAVYLISKEFGFIERLVENDYINMNKVERDATSYFTDESNVYGDKIWTTRLIMMLSVSNSPIKDLIYYLGKEDEDYYIKPGGYKLVFNDKKQ